MKFSLITDILGKYGLAFIMISARNISASRTLQTLIQKK